MARFQMKARPVWSALMLGLFAATVFAMFAISGTFISNLDDTFTYNYDNSAFRNGESCRIVVARPRPSVILLVANGPTILGSLGMGI